MAHEIRDLVEIGKKHFESRNYARAEQYFQKILKTGARYADVLNMLGIIYHADGKFNNAIESFEEALEVNPHYAEATLNLAVLYNDLGEFKKAKALYARIPHIHDRKGATDLDPILKGKIANLHAHLGDVYRGIGKYADAIDEYKKALKLCPGYADIRTKLGMSLRENGQKDQALKEFNAALGEKSAFKPARIQLGLTHYLMGQKDKASKAWKEVLAKDKDNKVVQTYLRLCENGKSAKE
ncbi:MAG TPA: tetratricopeptide repeat protein [bacterium]|nr:tetratricopeptide repeat protein [bacterium]